MHLCQLKLGMEKTQHQTIYIEIPYYNLEKYK